jgi:hypothetical protein
MALQVPQAAIISYETSIDLNDGLLWSFYRWAENDGACHAMWTDPLKLAKIAGLLGAVESWSGLEFLVFTLQATGFLEKKSLVGHAVCDEIGFQLQWNAVEIRHRSTFWRQAEEFYG